MLKIFFSGCWLGCLIICLGSCNKLVTVPDPRTSITTTKAFNNLPDAEGTVAGLYSLLMNSGQHIFSNGSATLLGGLSADDVIPVTGLNDALYTFYSNKLLLTNGEPKSDIWSPAYQVIYNANRIIEGIDASTATQLNDSTRLELKGEARFARALCYFYLTNLFGDVPLPLVSDFNQTAKLPRAPQAAVYAQIVLDLKTAQQGLPGDYSAGLGEKIRANKWAATALLARTYLYQRKWDSAEAQASAIIGSGQFSLCDTLPNVFLSNSQEAILQWKQDLSSAIAPFEGTWDARNFITNPNTGSASPWLDLTPDDQAAQLADPDSYTGGYFQYVGQYLLSPTCAAAFEPGDLRKSQWVVTLPTPSAAPYNGIPVSLPYKYTTFGDGTFPLTQYYMVLRLAEQYLIRAEARAQQGKNLSGAADDLNKVRNRAGLPNTTAVSPTDLLTAVAHERQVELFAEWGHRWLDLKRTGQAASVLGRNPDKQPWSDDWLLYPIPLTELQADPALKQNPGYQN